MKPENTDEKNFEASSSFDRVQVNRQTHTHKEKHESRIVFCFRPKSSVYKMMNRLI